MKRGNNPAVAARPLGKWEINYGSYFGCITILHNPAVSTMQPGYMRRYSITGPGTSFKSTYDFVWFQKLSENYTVGMYMIHNLKKGKKNAKGILSSFLETSWARGP